MHSHLKYILASRIKYLISTEALRNLQTQDIFYYNGCKLGKLLYILIEVFHLLASHLV